MDVDSEAMDADSKTMDADNETMDFVLAAGVARDPEFVARDPESVPATGASRFSYWSAGRIRVRFSYKKNRKK